MIPNLGLNLEMLILVAKIASIIVAGFAVAYYLRRVMMRLLIRNLPIHIASAVAKAVMYVTIALTLFVAAGTAGINLTGIAIAGGIAGIVLGFALQPVLSNLFAGLFLFSEKIVTPGSFVEIDNVIGTVMEVSIMSTKVQTVDGVIVRIPNSKIFESTVKNLSVTPIRRIDFVVSIAYKESAEDAYKVIRRVVEDHPFVLVEPPPDIFVHKLGSSGVDILVRVWVPTKLLYEVQKDLLWKIKKSISDAGIEIPFNQIDIWFRTPLKIEVDKK